MPRLLTNIVIFVLGCAFLVFLASRLISEHALPSFGEMMASSTGQLGTSTYVTSSPQNNISATSPTTSSSVKKRTAFDFPTTSLFTAKASVKVFVAHDNTDREQGLSDSTDLPQGTGVLFVFDIPGKYGFWMKDMHFPLDMIWINSNKTIIGVTKNVLPSSYPFVFMPPGAVSYVLEMNAGSVAPYGLSTGTDIHFSLP